MELPDLSQPSGFLLSLLVFFVIITGRYLLVSGIFYGVFYIWFRKKWERRKIGSKEYTKAQLRRETSWSLITAGSFALTGTITLWLWQQGYTSVYTDIHSYPLWWLPVSLAISMLIDETYYYWVHRWMHQPSVFKLLHHIHHKSSITSPWTAFAFHPLEGLLLAIVLPVTLMVLPMHPAVILVQLTIMTFTSVINHLDIEIYPAGFHKHRLGKWVIGATHHSLHHKQFKYNFGLYFTFWDKWKNTESPAFDKSFESATGPVQDPAAPII